MSNWSNDSQTHTQICILESQIEVKSKRVYGLEVEVLALQKENDRLRELIKTLVEGAE
jgi:hypothetical protein